jgi:hypothetical protein
MTHLTDEQFEDVMLNRTPPRHLLECRICADRLQEKQALAERLRRSLSGVQAGEHLAEQVKRKLRIRVQPAESPCRKHRGIHPRLWMAAAAAFAVIPLFTMLFAPSSAIAAKAELIQIHNLNIDPDHTFFSESDPVKLAAFFKRNLGFKPLMPATGMGLSLRGCCVQRFRGKEIGSYAVDTPNGIISIVVVPDTPADLGMKDFFLMNGYRSGKSVFADNSMVAVRIGNYTYCAIGQVSHNFLTSVLTQLLTDMI